MSALVQGWEGGTSFLKTAREHKSPLLPEKVLARPPAPFWTGVRGEWVNDGAPIVMSWVVVRVLCAACLFLGFVPLCVSLPVDYKAPGVLKPQILETF